ncbi:MAG: hypothetical protein PCFJNLEI_00636 [Verrucomicrobiae bacterium]|nr:hypothetical protein [Verrucomicrobiae bacterium]
MKVELRTYRGKPTLFVDGQSEPCYAYSYTFPAERPGGDEIHRKFAAHGCRWYLLIARGGVDGDWFTTPFWTDHNVFPAVQEDNLSRHAALVLKHCPDARFWVRIGAGPPKKWREQFSGELLVNCDGKRYDHASTASVRFHEQYGLMVENIVRYCEAQPWGERVAGYLVFPLDEGTSNLVNKGYCFDYSPVALAGFRTWLKDPTATIPAERNRPPTLHWPEPEEKHLEREYCRFMREMTTQAFRIAARAVKKVAPGKLVGFDAFKQTMLGWPLGARWQGDYRQRGWLLHAASGAFGMAELLDMPELDIVITPHDYLHRGMGFGYEPEGIGDAAVLRGKSMWIEEDSRTFSLPEQGRWNAMKDMTEVRAGLWRNLGAALSRGFNTYPMDVCGASFFMDDQIQALLGERRRVHEAATHWERREVPSIVMVIDDWSVLEEDLTLGYQWLAVQQQRLYGLARCGVPVRIHLLEDLAKANFPACHKVFLFPNLFRLTPERIALIREKVFRKGNLAIFGPATGIHGGTTELTGIPITREKMESPRLVTIDRFDHPITANLPRLDFGDSLPYGPVLIPGDLQRLGGIQWPQARDGVGLGIKQFADYAVIFSCAVPLPAELLREIARFSGTHVYGEADDLIFADSCSLTVHSVRPGKRVIKLPAATPVWDMIEKRKLGELAEIQLDVAGPQTKLFYLGEKP